jgi:hypothetical protein
MAKVLFWGTGRQREVACAICAIPHVVFTNVSFFGEQKRKNSVEQRSFTRPITRVFKNAGPGSLALHGFGKVERPRRWGHRTSFGSSGAVFSRCHDKRPLTFPALLLNLTA